MEGLIPFVYKAIVQYRNENQGPLAMWFPDSPSGSYMRLPGDSGRFQASDIHHFRPNYGCNNTTSSSPSTAATAGTAATTTSTTQVIVSSGVQSPVYRLTSRRVIA